MVSRVLVMKGENFYTYLSKEHCIIIILLKGVPMKQSFKALCVLALISGSIMQAAVLPYLAFRSQGFNAARELVGWQTQINKGNMCNLYGSFSVTPEYTRSFDEQRLSEYLFSDALTSKCSDSRCTSFTVQGTKVLNRDSKALMAENFYLPTDFSSVITIAPRIDNFLVDLNLYVGLDEWAQGLFFRIHTPITHTRWNLNFCENVISAGSNNYDPGYFNDFITGSTLDANCYGVKRSAMLDDFSDYIINGGNINTVAGVTFDSLQYARVAQNRMSKTALAELTAAFGWNFIACDSYHLGLEIRAAAPTGNRPHGRYVFEPIVGQGHHWELGVGLTTHANLWKSCDECQSFDVYLDANATHLFKTRQCRTFDLVDKPLSRYMLASKFGAPAQNLYIIDSFTSITPLLAGTSHLSATQFQKEFSPIANITTLPVDVSAAVQGDIVLKCAFTNNKFQWDFGYNFWGRSCEKICPRFDCCSSRKFPENTWGLKGDAFMFGFPAMRALPNPNILPQGVALSATESKATIFKGTNNYPDGLQGQIYPNIPSRQALWQQNPGIDSPKVATSLPDTTPFNGFLVILPTEPSPLPVLTSDQPVFIQQSDLDIDGARAKGMSNKVFMNFGYIFDGCECWKPYLGVGGEVEFGMHDKDFDSNCKTTKTCKKACKTSCKTSNNSVCSTKTSKNCKKSCVSTNNFCCKSAALSQWGIWVKGGISFN